MQTNSERRILKVILFALLLAAWAFVSIESSSAAEWHVYPGQSIQTAINNAGIGDTIYVHSGTYTENVNVDKQLTIQSENGSESTIIRAASKADHVFEVTADYVNISGFTVDGAKGAEWSKYGIYLEANYSIIANNNCSNNVRGIRLQRSNANTITNNICFYNGNGIQLNESNSNTITNNICFLNGNGIAVDKSNSNAIANNDCSNNAFGGIALEESNSNTITDNICSSNAKQLFKEGGIHLCMSNRNTITDNICSSNGFDGIELDVSNNNIIANNNCSNNHYCGIFFDNSPCNNNTIVNNICSSNHYDGIALWHYNYNNTITNNICFSNAYYGIEIVYSDSNTIYFNNFMNNTGNVCSHNSTNIWNSTEKITYTYKGKTYTNYLGNYWGDYTGSDADGDGIGDTAYVIPNDNDDSYPLMQPWETYFVPENQPPTSLIDSITPNPAKQGKDTVSFIGHGNDSDGSVVAYNWTSSIDGLLNTSPSFTKPASDLSVGVHTISFKVQDDDGAWSSAVTEILTILTNQPPVASFSYLPVNPAINETVTFNASVSYDLDGNITSYNWSFGDGNSTNTTELIVSHSYVSIGEYTVNLTVTDDEGATNRTYHRLKVFSNVSYFDTEPGTYPSICGIHNGTIEMTHTVNVSTIFIYPCTGTGGHIKYARIWNASWEGAEAHWHGYVNDWHNCLFDKNFTLLAGETYNYTIRTGSYPQIHHTPELLTAKGWIKCTEFTDANGKRYCTWIPAIKLE